MKFVLCLFALFLSSCATAHSHDGQPQQAEAKTMSTAEHHITGHHPEDEPRPYDKDADAETDINHTLVAAKEEGKMGLLVFGANWCHDSRALAAYFNEPRFQTLLREHYKLAYIDVGQKNRNIDLAQNFGVDAIVGTPTIFVTNSDGDVLNLQTAPTWRNAASRNVDDVFEYFRAYTSPDL